MLAKELNGNHKVNVGTERIRAVFDFCSSYIAEHGRGPSMAEIAESTEIPNGPVVWSMKKLRENGLVTFEPGDYRSMRIARPKGARSSVAGLLPPAGGTDSGASSAKEELSKVRQELQGKLDAVDAVLAFADTAKEELSKVRQELQGKLDAVDAVLAFL